MKTKFATLTLLSAAAAALFLAVPSASFAAPLDDGSNIPVAHGEVPARTCFLHAKELWNSVMAQSPRDHRKLDSTYRAFADCAKIAIDTGVVLRDGRRLPWLAEYFADTVGATYAQLQLATITANPEHCTHLTLARNLAEQASETEGDMGPVPDAQFESTWETLRKNVKTQSVSCGRSV